MKLTSALNRSLAALGTDPEDTAAVELAKKYAEAIDPPKAGVDRDALRRLGPHLLETLAELGMTPKARNAVVRSKVPNDGDSDKITQLRSRREQRAAALDAASS